MLGIESLWKRHPYISTAVSFPNIAWVRPVGARPSNLPKDGIAPLEGIVETSWAVAPFTMNWKFTRPRHRVRFEVDEPIAMIAPIQTDYLELFEPALQSLDDDAKLKESFLEWQSSRAAFIERLKTARPPSASERWQKHYFLAQARTGLASSHRQKLSVKPFEEAERGSP
jgi:hypothetical protein